MKFNLVEREAALVESYRVVANEVQFSRTGGKLERSVAPVRLVRLFDARRMVKGWE